MSKFLGQHFLTNQSALQKIVDSIPLEAGDLVIEIGPGKGALTYPLFEAVKKSGAKLIALEKDRRLALKLYQDLAKTKENFDIEEADALLKLEELSHKQPSYHIVGNIPYYITGRLLRIISELENKPKTVILTIQEEVAKKLSSQKGDNNLLSAITSGWAEAKILMRLSPDDFDPPPQVSSAIIQLTTKKDHPNKEQLLQYYAFLKSAFKQPKKTLLNNLSDSYKDIEKSKLLEFLQSQGLHEKTRARELSGEELTQLFLAFHSRFLSSPASS
ncbi:MAG: 16S rRNA (adenine(1518)-N(6)/adenine(1519)-N(6))-dimethyltransferase RsmA [bacterium]|nr:16S rRNA (adenine(1518)-N(6)/adenine(1519)-N(6))-dimethyltransferase RsmA [bacterium]